MVSVVDLGHVLFIHLVLESRVLQQFFYFIVAQLVVLLEEHGAVADRQVRVSFEIPDVLQILVVQNEQSVSEGSIRKNKSMDLPGKQLSNKIVPKEIREINWAKSKRREHVLEWKCFFNIAPPPHQPNLENSTHKV